MTRRTSLLALLIAPLMGAGLLAPGVAEAADGCEGFPGGICPPLSKPQRGLPANLASGWWNIRSTHTADLVLDVWNNSPADGAGFVVWPRHNGYNQQFSFQPRGRFGSDTTYQITVRSTGKCLQRMTARSNGAVQQWPCHQQSSTQAWHIVGHRRGGYQIKSPSNTFDFPCLDAANPSRKAPPAGAHVQVWECHGETNQAWMLVDAGPPPVVR